jgi:hypothetical protein
MEGSSEGIIQRVQAHAVESLWFPQRQTTNLYLDEQVIPAGETVGPKHLGIVTKQASYLVFADDVPLANFGHPCRYLFYGAESGRLAQTVSASLPPFLAAPETYAAFHEPVQTKPSSVVTVPLRPVLRCPILWERQRYAILWSGCSNTRHVNDLEFLYRTLIDVYGFQPSHIHVCNYDGTLNSSDGLPATWPGDNTPYRIQVNGKGDKAGFEAAIDDLKGRIDSDDLLLIATNNHGDGVFSGPPNSNFCCYPDFSPYYATDFAAKIAELPKFSKLICAFEPCFSGGFNDPVVAQSPAASTSVASAVDAYHYSWGSPDGNWDSFARDWAAAQAGHDPYGAALAFNPDSDGDGIIEAEEAFAYALAVKNPNDCPTFAESSEAGGDIGLGRQYTVWWWWCLILRELLEPHYVRLPIPEYQELLGQAQHELAGLAKEVDKASVELRHEFEPRLRAVIEETFGSR